MPAVDLLDRVGPARFAAHLRNAGLKLRMPQGGAPNLSLILGGGGTTLEELVGAYTALAREGMSGLPRLTPQSPLIETRLMSPGAAFIVREILENGGRPDAPFQESSKRVAWKTGTSFGFRDAWAVGVTDRYTLGIWVGRPDGTPNPCHFGANTAAPLVKDLLAALGTTNTRPRSVPANVRAVDICWPLGLAAEATPAAQCRVRRAAWTLDGTAPPTLPDRVNSGSLLETAWVDERQQQRLRPGCAVATDAPAVPHEFARWPALLEPWIDSDLRSDSGCSTSRPRCSASRLTADACRPRPRPAGRSGWVYTATTSPRCAAARSEGTANSGVPAKTILKAPPASTSRGRAQRGQAASVCLRCLASFLRTISRLSGER